MPKKRILPKAAEQGYTNAQYNLATCYGDGVGVEKDNQLAVKWLLKRACDKR